MSQEAEKRIKMATCQHCGKTTDITKSGCVVRLVAAYKTLKEERADILKLMLNQRANKNGQIQALNATIGKILDLMTEEQRKKAMINIRLLRGRLKGG